MGLPSEGPRHIVMLAKVDGWDDVRLRNAAIALQGPNTAVTVLLPCTGEPPPLGPVGPVDVRAYRVPRSRPERGVSERASPSSEVVDAPAVHRLCERDRAVTRARRVLVLSRFVGAPAARRIDSVHPVARLYSILTALPELVRPNRPKALPEPLLRLNQRDRVVEEARRQLGAGRRGRGVTATSDIRSRLSTWRTDRSVLRSLRSFAGELSPDALYVFDERAIPAASSLVRRRGWRRVILGLDLEGLPHEDAVRESVERGFQHAHVVTLGTASAAEALVRAGARRVEVVASAAPSLAPMPRTARDEIGATPVDRVIAMLYEPGREEEAVALAHLVAQRSGHLCAILTSRPSKRLARAETERCRVLVKPHPDLLAAFLEGLDAAIYVGADETGNGAQPTLLSVLQADVPLICADAPDIGVGDGVLDSLGAADGLPAVFPRASSQECNWDAQLDAVRAAWSLPSKTRSKAARPCLAIGPRNGNGQAWAWAQAVRRRAGRVHVETFAAEFETGALAMSFPADHRIPIGCWKSRSWQTWWARYVLRTFSHLLIEQALTSCGSLHGRLYFEEVPMLRARGIEVGLVFRGSEIRDPAAHAARHPWSPFHHADDPLTRRLQELVSLTRGHLEDFDGPVFVTTLDLLDDVPRARWLPQVLDLDVWRPGEAALQRRVPRVLHAPSREAIKGSHFVDRACSRLADLGLIEYVRVRGVPYADMPALVASADVVIDQLALGSYGVLALQALASERLVIGHVADSVRGRLPEPLPIVEATPSDLDDVLRRALDNRESFGEAALRGRDYVRRYHDGSYSARVLLGFVGEDPTQLSAPAPTTAWPAG
jgi:hypothetical protein